MTSLPIGTPALYNTMGISYEASFGHDPGLHSFITSMLLPRIPASGTVLDLGSGTGKPVAALISGAGHSLTGVDYSSTMISLARKQVPAATFEQSDILSYETERTFDGVVASMSLFNFSVEEMKLAVGKMAGWVREGGYLFIVTIKTPGYGRGEREVGGEGNGAKMVSCNFLGNLVEILLFTVEGWEKLLGGAGFEVVETKEHYFEPEGNCDPEPHYFVVAKKKKPTTTVTAA